MTKCIDTEHLPFHCLDCGTCTTCGGEYYMLRDSVWLSIHAEDGGMLCVGCLEERLGRLLNREDFSLCLLNLQNELEYEMTGTGLSARLYSRMKNYEITVPIR